MITGLAALHTTHDVTDLNVPTRTLSSSPTGSFSIDITLSPVAPVSMQYLLFWYPVFPHGKVI